MLTSFIKKDKPVEIKFIFDGDQVTLDDLIYIEHIQQGKRVIEEIKLLMCHFMVDKDGEYMEEEQAGKILGRLKTQEFAAAQEKFVNAISEASIPNETRPNSSSMSKVGPENPPPNGS